MQLFSIGILVLTCLSYRPTSSQGSTMGYCYIDTRDYSGGTNPQKKSTICSGLKSCPGRQNQGRCVQDGTSTDGLFLFVSCQRVNFSSALERCDKIGGYILGNNTSNQLKASFGQFSHDTFYKGCQKFWLCCKAKCDVGSSSAANVTFPTTKGEVKLDLELPGGKSNVTPQINQTNPNNTFIRTDNVNGNINVENLTKIIASVISVILFLCVCMAIFVLYKKLRSRKRNKENKKTDNFTETPDEEKPLTSKEYDVELRARPTSIPTPSGTSHRGGDAVNKQYSTGDPDKDYSIMRNRYNTFEHFPIEDTIFRQNLALVGFIYTGEGDSDKVKCIDCDVVMSGWSRSDDVFEEHRNAAPRCNAISSIIEAYNQHKGEVDPKKAIKNMQQINSDKDLERVSESLNDHKGKEDTEPHN